MQANSKTEYLYADITEQILSAAYKVHSALGPGLLESCYEACLAHELAKRGYKVERQVAVPVHYDGEIVECGYRIDLLVNGCIVIKLKAVEDKHSIHEAQLYTYLRLSGHRVGLLINFNVTALRNGIKRRII
jgi:GxxExxY protein